MSAHRQIGQQRYQGEVKAEYRVVHQDRFCRQRKVLADPFHEVPYAFTPNLHAFRFTCAARSKHDVGQILLLQYLARFPGGDELPGRHVVIVRGAGQMADLPKALLRIDAVHWDVRNVVQQAAINRHGELGLLVSVQYDRRTGNRLAALIALRPVRHGSGKL